MNERDKALGRLLLLRNLCTRDALQQAGQTTLARRAAGQQVEILVVLVEMGVLTTEVARGLWNEVAATPSAAPAAPVGAAAAGAPRIGAFARPAAPPARPLSPADDFSPVSTLSAMGDDGPPRGFSPLGTPAPATGAFNRPATGAFARPGTSAFAPRPGPVPTDDIALDDAPVSPVGFGAPPPATGGFGGFGGFGDFNAPAPTTGRAGGFDAAPAGSGFGGFGAPPPAFGSPNGSAFGMPAAPASSAFGMPAAPASSAFGMPAAPASSAFGMPAAPASSAFGMPAAPSAFGMPAAPSGFGMPAAPSGNFAGGFGSAPTNAFESPAESAFGGGFGAPAPAADLQSAFAPTPVGTATVPEPTGDGTKGSARTKKEKGPSGRSVGPASSRLTRTRAAGAAPPRSGGPPVVAIALAAVVVVGVSIGAYVMLKPKPGPAGPGTVPVANTTETPTTTTETDAPDPTPIVDKPVVNTTGGARGTELVVPQTAPPTKAETDAQSWTWAEELLIRAWDLREAERYEDAVKVLEGFPKVLQTGEGFQKVQEKLAEYSRFGGFKKKLEAAIAAGSSSEELKTYVGRIESGKMERDLLELPCINRFKEEARRVLSPAVYDEIAVKWMELPTEVNSADPVEGE